MNFRYDIGFLRAIAVISVLFFHFKIDLFKGGFIGVDVFFVISGYLMTRIILNGFSKNKFSLRDFYVRRAKRIMPLLIVVGFSLLLVSSLLFFNTDASQNAKNVVLSNLFLSNIYYWLYNGYFDAASQNNIFIHSWTLSVEGQFYILYPLLLMPLKRLYFNRLKTFKGIFIIFTLISLLACFWVTKIDNSFAFYMFPTRAWEMTLGGIAFLFADKIECSFTLIFRKRMVLIGYLSILASVLLISESNLWPSSLTLIPTIGTFMVIAFNSELKWMEFKSIQFLGNISYSLYIWHWPVFIVFQYFGLTGGYNIFCMFVLSILLSIMSYYYVEINKWFQSTRFVVIGTFLVVVLGIVMFKFPSNILSRSISLYDDYAYTIGNYRAEYYDNIREKQFNSNGCFITIGDTYEEYNFLDCLTLNESKKNVLILGDSHAAQFSQSLREQLPAKINMLEMSAGISFPFLKPKGKPESVKLINELYDRFLLENIDYLNLVVLSVHWPMHLNAKIAYSEKEILQEYSLFLSYFKDRGIPILVIGQQETYIIDFSKIEVIKNTFGSDSSDDFYNKYLDNISKKYNDMIKSITPEDSYVDVYKIENMPKISSVGIPYMVDKNHYSKFGADYVVENIVLARVLEVLEQ